MPAKEISNSGAAKEVTEATELTEVELENIAAGATILPSPRTHEGKAKNRRVEIEVVGTRNK